ncbi:MULTISPECIES: cytochrome c [unclassified Pseudomonas]|uniref:c-type cytochrome n=1 Tax=unclassified Pseudomonas TaxID=196821 RepID=UPI000C8832D7|nr:MULTISPECIES: c-type cytochrome [unclassified Pseudomonas]PMZ73240.1 cytochrome c [Pseudomonas sp. GW247-3R2A]PMY73370.1 cytochrome c [Pseudomonas sp. MPR-R3A]PMY98050.1 cytochrome c [Pseudomonas sp. FW305-124]PNA92638.1 cytochrome c [Pseudomonas sp. FW300-E2]PNB03190.1 cytochrome c [Pseudomonas sp. MPR-AND1B]
MKKNISFGLLLLSTAITAQAADAPAPAQLAICSACHGAQGEGNVTLGAPRLAGQQASYLAHQLRSLKSGKRGYDPRDQAGVQMRAIAAGLNDTDNDRLAEHYAAQRLPMPVTTTAERQHGQARYQGTCAACHGPNAEGYAHLKTPNLRILGDWYIDKQLTNYVRGLRGSHAHGDQLGIWMGGISLQIDGADERQAIIGYIGSLPANP